MEIQLHSSFRVSGNDMDEFLDTITQMANATFSMTLSSSDIVVYAVVNTQEDVLDIAITRYLEKDKTFEKLHSDLWERICSQLKIDSLPLYGCNPERNFCLRAVKLEHVRAKAGMTEELINDIFSTKLIFGIDGKMHYVSDFAISTINNRVQLGGEAMCTPSVGHAVEIAKSFHHKNRQQIQFIVRMIKDTRVILAAHSQRYTYVPQTILKDLYERISELSKTSCVKWEVAHDYSYCYVGLPDLAAELSESYDLPDTITPGIYMSTSDTGDSSIILRGFWDINGHIIGGKEIRRNHRGEIDTQKFVDDAWSKLFDGFAAIPERLVELLAIDVENPVWTIRDVFRQIGMNKANGLGKKGASRMLHILSTEIDPERRYTAYDIALMITSIPDRAVGLHISTIERLQDIVRKAVFADYTRSYDSKSEDFYLE